MQRMGVRLRETGHASAVHHCRRCGARILWARTDRGKRMPLDVAPNTTAGTVAIDRHSSGLHASVFGHQRAAALREAGHRLYVPHVATCQG